MQGCVFCKIISGDSPSSKRYEDLEFLAFDDIVHEAPVDVIVVPKKHIHDLRDIDYALVGRLQLILPKIAEKLGLGRDFQISLNSGKYQEVQHLHYHLKGGEK